MISTEHMIITMLSTLLITIVIAVFLSKHY